jgi:hypothetical protein
MMLPNPRSAEMVEMKIQTSEEKSRMKTSNIIMVDDEPDVNMGTFK